MKFKSSKISENWIYKQHGFAWPKRCETASVKNQHKYFLKSNFPERKNKHIICQPRSVRIGKNFGKLGKTQFFPIWTDLGRQITNSIWKPPRQLALCLLWRLATFWQSSFWNWGLDFIFCSTYWQIYLLYKKKWH